MCPVLDILLRKRSDVKKIIFFHLKQTPSEYKVCIIEGNRAPSFHPFAVSLIFQFSYFIRQCVPVIFKITFQTFMSDYKLFRAVPLMVMVENECILNYESAEIFLSQGAHNLSPHKSDNFFYLGVG